MALAVTKVDVWAGDIPDQPGGLSSVLGALADAGADLECVIARRQPDKPGKGVVFVSPVKGKKAQDAARGAGLKPAANIGTVRVEGPDRPGAGSRFVRAIADAGINVRGVSAAVIGNKFVAYIGVDGAADAAKAAQAVKKVNGAAKKPAGKKAMAR